MYFRHISAKNQKQFVLSSARQPFDLGSPGSPGCALSWLQHFFIAY